MNDPTHHTGRTIIKHTLCHNVGFLSTLHFQMSGCRSVIARPIYRTITLNSYHVPVLLDKFIEHLRVALKRL